MQGDSGGALNADDASFLIGANQWVNMENCRTGSTDNGVTGTVESIGSTVLISQPSPSVTFVPIGSAFDIDNNRFAYFLCNLNTSEHKIECYYPDTNTAYLVLISSQVTGGLNFNKNYLIHSARIVNGILYWTDDLNQPRKLNIDAAIKMNNPSFVTDQATYTNPLVQEVIALIRKPPGLPLSISKFTAGLTVNNIDDFAGQFSYRYIFRDGEESVLSPISSLAPYNYRGETSDSILLIASFSEKIAQDVQQVDYCVRVGNTGNFSIIKSWNKNITSDAVEIANHNNGIIQLQTNFINDVTGVVLDLAYSLKQSDSVPLLSRGLEVGENRLFLSYNLTGYASPTISSLSFTLLNSSPPVSLSQRLFKCNSNYRMGIIFRDKYKREIGSLFTNDSLKIEIPDRNYSYSTYCFSIEWGLSNISAINEIPINAYYYDICLTKNLNKRFFVEGTCVIMYAIKNPSDGVITYQNNYSAGAYAVALNTLYINSKGMGYAFQEGDLAKIYLHASPFIVELNVIDQNGEYILCSLSNLGTGADLSIFEVYTPYKESINEPFFTLGEGCSLLINNPETSSREYSQLIGYIQGDVFAEPISIVDSFGTTVTFLELMSPNYKFWKNWYVNSGQPAFVFLSQQIRKRTSIQYSNTLVQGSNINGLSTFDALDEKLLPEECGSIQKIINTSKVGNQLGIVMLAICDDETVSLYLGEVQQYGSNAPTTLASAPNVIGTTNILKGNYGTNNPESVVEYRGNVFWLDMRNGKVIQYSANGLYPISNYKMTRFWKLFCDQFLSMTTEQIEALGSRPFVFSTVDPHHNEVLFTIPKLLLVPPRGYLPDYPSVIYPFDIYDGQAKTLVYNLDASPNHWQGSYSFTPEWFIAFQNKLYSFKTGLLYKHNELGNYCNFYGVQYKAKIMCISNMQPDTPKVYDSISVQSNMQPTFVYFYNNYPYQQSSDLVDYQFSDLEGIFYCTLRRNKLQPTAFGFTSDSLLTGEKMRNVAMFILLEFSVNNVPLELKFVDIGFILSKGHTR